jgi:hypothetical protein
MMVARRITPAVVLLALALPACGGSSSSSGQTNASDQVTAAWNRYVNALVARNGTAVCNAMSPALVQQFRSAVAHSASTLAGASCPEVFRVIFAHADPSLSAAIKAVGKGKLTKLRINGSSAAFTVKARTLGQTFSVPGKAQKGSSGWQISCCVGF